MYLSIGNGKYVREKKIIGIFDMDTATICIATRNFLSKAQKEKRITLADEDIPKSFILTDGEKVKDSITLCKLSSTVLLNRIGKSHTGYAIEEENE